LWYFYCVKTTRNSPNTKDVSVVRNISVISGRVTFIFVNYVPGKNREFKIVLFLCYFRSSATHWT